MSFGANLKTIRQSKKYTVEMKYSGWRGQGKKNCVEKKVIKNISQCDISSELGIAQSRLSDWENGRGGFPNVGTLIKMCNYFGCTPNDLLKGEYKESTNE